MIEALIKKIFEGTIKEGDLDEGLWNYTKKRLINALQKGFKANLNDLDAGTGEYESLKGLIDNINSFAAHKDYQIIKLLAESLFDDDGKLRSFSEFKKLALEIHEEWNVRWLEAEYNLAVASAQAARQWQERQDMKQDFPKLKYVTVKDENVRETHKKLEGIVRPVDDVFWKTYFPPNGWGCRCVVISVGKDEKTTPKSKLTDLAAVPAELQHNPGITKEVFNNSHPYYDVSKTAKSKIDAFLKS